MTPLEAIVLAAALVLLYSLAVTVIHMVIFPDYSDTWIGRLLKPADDGGDGVE